MTLPPLRSRCRAPLVAVLAGVAVGLTLPPARGQENRPTVRHSHPVVRLDRRHTRVSLEFTVPAGFALADRPWIRIVEANGKPFLSTRPLFTQRDPLWKGYRDLNTEDFPAGAYRMRVEVEVLNPQGKRETVASDWAPFVVPKR